MSTDEQKQKLAEHYYWCGTSYGQGGNPSKAIKYLEKAADLGFKSEETYTQIGFIHRSIADELEDEEEAKAEYRTAAGFFKKAAEAIET